MCTGINLQYIIGDHHNKVFLYLKNSFDKKIFRPDRDYDLKDFLLIGQDFLAYSVKHL